MSSANESTYGQVPGPELVFIILAHNQPRLLERLVRCLDHPSVGIVVHLDGRVDRSSFSAVDKVSERVLFVPHPVKVRWAAFSQVESTLLAMQFAVHLWGDKPSHHIVLSGVDYPLKSTDDLLAFMSRHKRKQFARRFDVFGSSNSRQIRRITGHHFRELADRNTFPRKPLFVLEYALRLFPRKLPSDITFVSGSNWLALTTEFVQWALAFVEDNPQFVGMFRGMFAPDEIFLHTLLQNSPYADQAPAIEPYYQVTELGGPWKYGNLHFLNPIDDIVDLYSLQSYLSVENVFFARKFRLPASGAVLAEIDSLRREMK